MEILFCDDHQIVRDGLKRILQQLKEIVLIKEASNAQELYDVISHDTFDIVILDISLPDKSGMDLLKYIKDKYNDIGVLMLSMHPQEQYALRALKLGASGYLTKDSASEELLVAVKNIYDGKKYISKSFADSVLNNFNKKEKVFKHELLSEREFQIMIKIAKGKSLIDIGDELFISPKTVSTYRSRLMDKLNFNKNAELTKYCIEHDLI
jgi:DNA-binding NarL/FixJ family response regulator